MLLHCAQGFVAAGKWCRVDFDFPTVCVEYPRGRHLGSRGQQIHCCLDNTHSKHWRCRRTVLRDVHLQGRRQQLRCSRTEDEQFEAPYRQRRYGA